MSDASGDHVGAFLVYRGERAYCAGGADDDHQWMPTGGIALAHMTVPKVPSAVTAAESAPTPRS